jgi:tetratricopeptide (TPR) repeat protein
MRRGWATIVRAGLRRPKLLAPVLPVFLAACIGLPSGASRGSPPPVPVSTVAATPMAPTAPPNSPDRSAQVGATEEAIARLQERISATPDDGEAYRDLGLAFLQRVRERGDPALYDLADEALGRARRLRPTDPLVLVGVGTLQLARHEFADALVTGQAALRVEPQLASAQGVEADALVELGRYNEAVEAVQRMVDIRPDAASLARVSYLRELHGDLDGAVEAMRTAAAEAGRPENVAYLSVLLGDLLVYQGERAAAAESYERALDQVPEFPSALAGQARLAVAADDLDAAVALYGRAAAILPLPEYVVGLGEAREAEGDVAGAVEQYALARFEVDLYRSSGVVVDLELALFEADHGDPKEALRLAEAAYAERRTVRTADALAWALYRTGRIEQASARMDDALALGTRLPLLHFHAGSIAAARGDRRTARRELEAALALDAGFSATGAARARALLADLGD